MPSLPGIPDDGLYDRLVGLRRDVRETRTVRRNTPHNLKVGLGASSQSIAAATSTKVTFGGGSSAYVVYSNPADAFDVSSSLYTVPSSGLYLVVCNLILATGSAQRVIVSFDPDLGGYARGNRAVEQSQAGRGVTLTTVTPLLAGQEYMIWTLMDSGGSVDTDSSLTLQRLSDLPENADQPT